MSNEKVELVKQLEINGDKNEPLAVFGTSIEYLNNALNKGYMDWSVPQENEEVLPYQEKLLKRGGHLYFAYPLLDNLQRFRPGFSQKLEKRIKTDHANFSPDHLLKRITHYAMGQAIEHSFQRMINSKATHWSIVGLSYIMLPNYLFQLSENGNNRLSLITDIGDFRAEINEQEPFEDDYNLPDNLTIGELKEILTDSLRRRGIAVFLNREILKGKLFAGYEETEEMIIRTQKPLDLNAISGIKFFSGYDKLKLMDIISK